MDGGGDGSLVINAAFDGAPPQHQGPTAGAVSLTSSTTTDDEKATGNQQAPSQVQEYEMVSETIGIGTNQDYATIADPANSTYDVLNRSSAEDQYANTGAGAIDSLATYNVLQSTGGGVAAARNAAAQEYDLAAAGNSTNHYDMQAPRVRGGDAKSAAPASGGGYEYSTVAAPREGHYANTGAGDQTQDATYNVLSVPAALEGNEQRYSNVQPTGVEGAAEYDVLHADTAMHNGPSAANSPPSRADLPSHANYEGYEITNGLSVPPELNMTSGGTQFGAGAHNINIVGATRFQLSPQVDAAGYEVAVDATGTPAVYEEFC